MTYPKCPTLAIFILVIFIVVLITVSLIFIRFFGGGLNPGQWKFLFLFIFNQHHVSGLKTGNFLSPRFAG